MVAWGGPNYMRGGMRMRERSTRNLGSTIKENALAPATTPPTVKLSSGPSPTPSLGDGSSTLRQFRPYLIGASVIPVVASLYLARGVLIPVALAGLLTFLLSPIVGGLERAGLWRVRGGGGFAPVLRGGLGFSPLGGGAPGAGPQGLFPLYGRTRTPCYLKP